MAWIDSLAAGIGMFKKVPRRILLRQAEADLENMMKLFQRECIRETNLAVHLGFRADVGHLAQQGSSRITTFGADLRQICDL